MPSVWILVLNYCSYEDTLACVESVRRLSYPDVALLVLDNASPDGGGKLLSQKLQANEFLQLARNTGYAGGNNLGIRWALKRGADYVCVVNPDVRLSADCISRYVEVCESDASIGAVNSVQVGADGVTIDPKYREAILAAHGYSAEWLTPQALPESFEARTLFGAALFLRAQCLRHVGGFDPLYFAYGEEQDLCRRIRLHQFKLLILRDPAVKHLRTRESLGVSDFVLYLRLKGHYLYRIKSLQGSFLLLLRDSVVELFGALSGTRPSSYPYDRFPIRRVHILLALWWLVLHAPLVWKHRGCELRGRCHL